MAGGEKKKFTMQNLKKKCNMYILLLENILNLYFCNKHYKEISNGASSMMIFFFFPQMSPTIAYQIQANWDIDL